MAQTQRDTSDQVPYIPFRGPFGGIQSEVPLDFMEGLGYADALNMIFRQSRCTTRPGYNALPALPNADPGPIMGIFDFFNAVGVRIQCVITPIALYTWNGSAWTVITGTLTGGPGQLFSFSVLDYLLLFSQGQDVIQQFDGISGAFTPTTGGFPAKFLCQISFHLCSAYTIEESTVRPQRFRWTGVFDPNDNTSYDSGFVDLTNDLGPITGLANVYQTGFIFQQKGITQAVPTGVGTQPFNFVQMSSKAKGNICPFSLAYYGDQIACYVGQDNIYLFDSVQSYPIGDMPMGGQGPTRIGARSRIFAELKLTNLNLVSGFITTTIAGNPFNAYWLIIPGGSVWVYHFDELCWSRFTYSYNGAPIQPFVIGDFDNQSGIEIEDLIGTIAQQTWTPDTLVDTAPLNDIAIGFQNGLIGDVNFTNYSETAWSLTSGSIRFQDSRNTKYINRMRIVQQGLLNTAISYDVVVTNNVGLVQPTNPSMSNDFGSGQMGEQLVDISQGGLYFQYVISSDDTLSPISIAEIGFDTDTGQPYRGV
jgi:hypothetical protein